MAEVAGGDHQPVAHLAKVGQIIWCAGPGADDGFDELAIL